LTVGGKEIKYPYMLTAIGICLAAITTIYGLVRTLMFREMARPTGNPGGARQFAENASPFGLMNSLTTLAVIVAIIGVVWLGLTLRKPHNPRNPPATAGT
jgi:hypothetical protein